MWLVLSIVPAMKRVPMSAAFQVLSDDMMQKRMPSALAIFKSSRKLFAEIAAELVYDKNCCLFCLGLAMLKLKVYIYL